MLDIIEFVSGAVSLLCFFAWLLMLIMEMAVSADDQMPEPTSSWSFEKIGPILFFCWMATMCLYFAVGSLT